MGRIIVPGKEIIAPFASTRMGVDGLYRCQIRKERTGKLKYDTGWFHNLVTNLGLNQMWSVGQYQPGVAGQQFQYGCVGTGSTTPTVNDIALAAYTTKSNIGGASTTGYVAATGTLGQPGYTAPYWYLRKTWTFPTGTAAGNLTEVGNFPNSQFSDHPENTYLYSRALILDSDGNPTSITVLSDEVLTVTWELRYYLDVSDHSFSFNLNGSPITGVYRLDDISNTPLRSDGYPISSSLQYNHCSLFSGDIGAVTGRPSGTILGTINTNSGSSFPWVSGSFTDDIDNTGTCYVDIGGIFPTSIGNGTALSFELGCGGTFSFQFGQLSSPIIKTSGQQLAVNFRVAWGRYTP